MSEGFGVKRYPVMYNDFVLIGPENDPADVKGKDIVTALQTIKAKSALFISRANRSGTNIAEIELWKDAGIDISKDKGLWYKEVGHGMGATLSTAAALDAYVLSDRGSWLAFKYPGDLYEAFPADEARRLVERFEWHYTPKHGSWLNLAESELGVLTSQCLDRRMPDKRFLKSEVAACEANRNKKHTKANWRFTTESARVKLKNLYPSF